jgi:hypothetical protein
VGDSQMEASQIQHGEPRRLVMSAPTPLRQDFDASQLRGLARKTKDGPQARRLLALAAIYDGATPLGSMLPITMGREFIAHSTKTLHFLVGLSSSASSHHDLSLPASITNIVESDFSVYTAAQREL